MLQNEYYNEHLNEIVKDYNVPWVTTSDMYKFFET